MSLPIVPKSASSAVTGAGSSLIHISKIYPNAQSRLPLASPLELVVGRIRPAGQLPVLDGGQRPVLRDPPGGALVPVADALGAPRPRRVRLVHRHLIGVED